MSVREVRRLAMLALTLLCFPILAMYSLMPVSALFTGVENGGDLVLLRPALISAVVLIELVWLTWRYSDGVGRIFTPERLGGAALLGCAAIRVLCLRQLIVGFCSGLNWVLPADQMAVFEVSWPTLCVGWLLVPLASLLLFFAAPWIAKWVVGQVDSGVTWWGSFLRWAKG